MFTTRIYVFYIFSYTEQNFSSVEISISRVTGLVIDYIFFLIAISETMRSSSLGAYSLKTVLIVYKETGEELIILLLWHQKLQLGTMNILVVSVLPSLIVFE